MKAILGNIEGFKINDSFKFMNGDGGYDPNAYILADGTGYTGGSAFDTNSTIMMYIGQWSVGGSYVLEYEFIAGGSISNGAFWIGESKNGYRLFNSGGTWFNDWVETQRSRFSSSGVTGDDRLNVKRGPQRDTYISVVGTQTSWSDSPGNAGPKIVDLYINPCPGLKLFFVKLTDGNGDVVKELHPIPEGLLDVISGTIYPLNHFTYQTNS